MSINEKSWKEHVALLEKMEIAGRLKKMLPESGGSHAINEYDDFIHSIIKDARSLYEKELKNDRETILGGLGTIKEELNIKIETAERLKALLPESGGLSINEYNSFAHYIVKETRYLYEKEEE